MRHPDSRVRAPWFAALLVVLTAFASALHVLLQPKEIATAAGQPPQAACGGAPPASGFELASPGRVVEPDPALREPVAESPCPAAALQCGDPPIVLRIHARGDGGAAIPMGSVLVAHAVRGLGNPGDRREIQVRDTSFPARVELPPDRRLAEITVSAPGYQPASALLEQLRLVEGRWIDEAIECVRDVEVTLERGRPALGIVWGRILVEGTERLPRDLRIDVRAGRLLPRPGPDGPRASVAPIARATPPRARIDPHAIEYQADVVVPGPHVLTVSSAETIVRSFEVQVPHDLAAQRCDLELASGCTLLVHAVHARTQAPVDGLVVRLQYTRTEAENPAARVVRTHESEATTAAGGRAWFGGLPAGARMRVRATWIEPGRVPRDAEVEVDLPEACGASAECRLWVAGPAPDACEVHGLVDASWWQGRSVEEAGVSICWGEVGRPGPCLRRPVRGADWHFQSPPDRDLEVWVERGGERVTERTRVRTRPGRLGPVVLSEPLVRDLRVAWSGAPIGWTLELLTGDRPAGAATEASRTLDAADGEWRTRRFARSDLGLLLTSPHGARWYQRWDGAALGDGLSVAFAPAVMIEIDAPGDVLREVAALEARALVLPAGVVECGLSTPMREGRSLERVPVLAGDHFFRADTRGAPLMLCGVERHQGTDAAWRLGWKGLPLDVDATAGAAPRGLQCAACTGADLSAVPLQARRIYFSQMERVESRPLRILVDSERCRVEPF